MSHWGRVGLRKRSKHFLKTHHAGNGLHNPKGIDGESRQANLKTRVPWTSQLDLLKALPLLTNQRSTEQDPVLPWLQCVIKRLIIISVGAQIRQ